MLKKHVERENPNSNKVIAEGKIGVYVFPGKERLLKDKAGIIEMFKKKKKKADKQNKKDQAKSEEKNNYLKF